MAFKLEIDGWKTGIRFSAAHILPKHKRCGVLHGHTYAIHARIFGDKDKQDFVMDFSIVKKYLKNISESLDHKILIPEKNNYFKNQGKEIKIEVDDKKYILPKEDCALIPIKNITAENLAEYILKILIDDISFPKNVKKLDIGVDEGFGQGAWIEKVIG